MDKSSQSYNHCDSNTIIIIYRIHAAHLTKETLTDITKYIYICHDRNKKLSIPLVMHHYKTTTPLLVLAIAAIAGDTRSILNLGSTDRGQGDVVQEDLLGARSTTGAGDGDLELGLEGSGDGSLGGSVNTADAGPLSDSVGLSNDLATNGEGGTASGLGLRDPVEGLEVVVDTGAERDRGGEGEESSLTVLREAEAEVAEARVGGVQGVTEKDESLSSGLSIKLEPRAGILEGRIGDGLLSVARSALSASEEGAERVDVRDISAGSSGGRSSGRGSSGTRGTSAGGAGTRDSSRGNSGGGDSSARDAVTLDAGVGELGDSGRKGLPAMLETHLVIILR